MPVSPPLGYSFALVAAGSIALTACSSSITSRSVSLPPASPSTPTYDGRVSISPSTRSINAEWLISFRRTPAMTDSVALLLNRSLQITRLSGRGVTGFTESVEGDRKRITVRLAPTTPDASATVNISYEGVPTFGTDTINGISDSWMELGLDSFWHPVFADFSKSVIARVALNIPSGWDVVTSGSVDRASTATNITSTVSLIDIPLVAAPRLEHSDGDRVSVYHAPGERAELVAKTLATTQQCTRYLDERYSTRERAMPPVKMVIAPRGGPGYARKNYIVITRVADTATVALTRFICHELAHFWSSGAISSGPENWLNEGFAEFISARYVKTTLGDSAYASILTQWQNRAKGQPAIWTPESTRRPMPGTSYGKAPYLLHRLEERIGTPAMDRLLVRYMRESTASTPALVHLVTAIAGAETGTWFRDQLATP